MKIILVAVNAKFIHSNLAIRDLKAFAEKRRKSLGICDREGQRALADSSEREGYRAPADSSEREGHRAPADSSDREGRGTSADSSDMGLQGAYAGSCRSKIRAMLGEKGAETVIELAEYTINQQPDRVLADLYRRHPDVIAFSCYVWNMAYIGSLLADLHQILPRAEFWLGGPEVSYDAAQVLRNFPDLRGVMVGEGEITFTRLVSAYESAERSGSEPEFSGIGGIVYRSDRKDGSGRKDVSAKNAVSKEETREIHRNVPSEMPDLDEIPFFYRDVEPSGEEVLRAFDHRIIYYESSRGCPFQCSYCLSSIGNKVRFRSLEQVKRELQFFLDAGVPQVKFVDRTFNCDHAHATAIWQYILEHDNGITNFHFEIEAELLTEDEIRLLSRMRPGLVQLEIGVQSTNPATLCAIRRPQKIDHLRQIVSEIHAAGNIHQHLDLIAGLPEENLESFGRSFDEVYRMQPQQLQMGFLKLLKGSALYRDAEKFGIVCHKREPYEVIRTKWLSYDDVLRLKEIEEMVEVYYNSWQFSCTMRVLTERDGSPFHLYSSLADYYSMHHLTEINLSRSERFEALRGFARAYDPEHEELYRELLVLDLYLRENSRSRPEWARDLTPYRDLFHRCCREKMGEKPDRRMLHGDVFLPETLIVSGFAAPESRFLKAPGDKPVPVVFDYRERDGLTGNAKVTILPERFVKEEK